MNRPSLKKSRTTEQTTPARSPLKFSRSTWLLLAGCVLVVLIAVFCLPPGDDAFSVAMGNKSAGPKEFGDNTAWGRTGKMVRRSSPAAPPKTAEEIVWSKVTQFGRTRRELAREAGRRAGKDVPSDVEKFFDAIDSGRWEEIDARWSALSKQSGQYDGSTHREELDP